jgi:glycosyltransferase involved in cell wall biosynthesis
MIAPATDKKADAVRVGVFDQIVSGGGVRFFTLKLLEEFSRLSAGGWRFHLMWPLFDSSDKFLAAPRLGHVTFERISLDTRARFRNVLLPALREVAGRSARWARHEDEVRRDEQQALRAGDGRGLRWLDERAAEFDLIYLPYPYLTLPGAGGWRPKKPLVITLHDLAHEETDAWGDLTEPLRREVPRWTRLADLVIFSSDYVKREAQKLYGLPEERARRIHLAPAAVENRGGPDARARHGLTGKYVFTLGWAAKHKRVDTIVEGFALFKRRTGADVALVVAGPRTETLTAGDTHGLEAGRDLFALGYVADEDIPGLYRAAEAVVTASVSEAGLNAMIFDAMSYGRPVICSNIPQFVERLGADDALALTFDPLSPQSLAAALDRHFADPVSAASRARAAKKFIDSRTLSDVGRDYLAAFKSALGKSAPSESA